MMFADKFICYFTVGAMIFTGIIFGLEIYIVIVTIVGLLGVIGMLFSKEISDWVEESEER